MSTCSSGEEGGEEGGRRELKRKTPDPIHSIFPKRRSTRVSDHSIPEFHVSILRISVAGEDET